MGGQRPDVLKEAATLSAGLEEVLERHGKLNLEGAEKEQLCKMSPGTVDSLLKLRRSISATKPGSLLKAAIPIHPFADWNEKQPYFLEVDLVAHSGESTKGFYIVS